MKIRFYSLLLCSVFYLTHPVSAMEEVEATPVFTQKMSSYGLHDPNERSLEKSLAIDIRSAFNHAFERNQPEQLARNFFVRLKEIRGTTVDVHAIFPNMDETYKVVEVTQPQMNHKYNLETAVDKENLLNIFRTLTLSGNDGDYLLARDKILTKLTELPHLAITFGEPLKDRLVLNIFKDKDKTNIVSDFFLVLTVNPTPVKKFVEELNSQAK